MLRNAINSPMLKALSIALMLGLVAVSAPTPAFADDDHREPNYHPDFHNGRYLPNHGKRYDGHYSKRYYKKHHYRKHRHRDHDGHAAGLAIGLFALGAAAAIASSPRYHHPPRRHYYEYHHYPRHYGYHGYRDDPLAADN